MANVKSILTTYGNAQILNAIAHETNVIITGMVYGDGGGYPYEANPAQTQLINQLGVLTNITKQYDNLDGFIYFKSIIPASEDSYTIRELGLIDSTNKLIAVATIPDVQKPSVEEGIEISLPISLGFKTSTGEVMLIDTGMGHDYPTMEYLEEHYYDKDQTEENFQKLSEKGQSNGYCPLGEDTKVPEQYLPEINTGSSFELGDIIFRSLPTSDAAKHLADGALINGSGIYSGFVDYIADLYTNNPTAPYFMQESNYLNATRVGGTLSSNYVFTGGASAYLSLNSIPDLNSASSWEFKTKYTFNGGGSIASIIATHSSTGNGGFILRADTSTGVVSTYISSVGDSSTSSWDIASIADVGLTLVSNTTYYLKYGFDGTKYYLDYNTDGSDTYTSVWSVTSSTKVGTLPNVTLMNSQFNAATEYSAGSMDLNETSLSINGSVWWQGVGTKTPEENWQTQVTTYGSCGKYVYDSVNNTVRLPKISDILECTTDINALGDLTEAGLPDHTHNVPLTIGTFLWQGGGTPAYSIGYSPTTVTSQTAQSSNPIYGNSTTVQPQTIKGLIYIIIATTTKTDIEVDIDEVITDLNGKADVDLSNVNDIGTSKSAGWTMPSDTYVNLTLGASGATYQAPANGWFVAYAIGGGACAFYIINNSTLYQDHKNGASGNGISVVTPALKGETVELGWYNVNILSFRFIYAQGSKSQAN